MAVQSSERIRQIMLELCPDGFDKRFPGILRIARSPLVALGPFHEVSGDGHDKLNSQALRMGPISLPLYGVKDKWSDMCPYLVVVPNNREEAAVAHMYLDFVERVGGKTCLVYSTTRIALLKVLTACPLQFTTDCGSETGWVYAYQYALRYAGSSMVIRLS